MKGIRLEKVNNNIVRVIVEKPSDVPVEQLMSNREQILKNIEAEEKQLITHEAEIKIRENIKVEKEILANLDEMLDYCKKVGIVPKPVEVKKSLDCENHKLEEEK